MLVMNPSDDRKGGEGKNDTENDTLGTTIIRGGEGPKPFLAGGIPDGKFILRASDGMDLRLEIHPDRRLRFRRSKEELICEAQ